MSASKVTGQDMELVGAITSNDGTNATLTVTQAESLARLGVTTIVFNGGGAHLDAANGVKRYRVKLEQIN